ncbi:rhodanese-like domain-containing protein [Deinococcus aluminii]|uniref:Thiosulfate sulfurtransferase GlpE n=1 Tax=Deinococcus aluminii TaxID=1656885 RepID=A0ABP9XFA6_9DEIO
MPYQDIFTTELEQKRREGAALVDVREREEYAQGHIPGAVNLPLSELRGREDEVPDGAVLICASGNRSSQAASYLESLGKRGLSNLSGGTITWMREGRELNQGEQP